VQNFSSSILNCHHGVKRIAHLKRAKTTKHSSSPLDQTKKKRPNEKTSIKILNAATIEFARWGYGGARIERISARAGTNDRSLYYYFSSKKKLFRVVLEHAYLKLAQAEVALQIDRLEPIEGIEKLVTFTWKYYIENPELLSLINTENLHRGEHIKQSSLATTISSTQLDIIQRLVTRGSSLGVFHNESDPIHIFLTIAALSYFYLSNRYTLTAYLGVDMLESKRMSRWLEHMKSIVVQNLLIKSI
jgi:AcrR family transcriptional regulator